LTYFELHSAIDAKNLQPVNLTEIFNVYFKPALISISSQNVNLKTRILLAPEIWRAEMGLIGVELD
jgi:hypothetical protein